MDGPKRIAAPLQFLPAFELTARHLSFKRAAQELHLTASAVSQQIRALEGALGLKLFRRLTRALELTPAGEQFAAVVTDTLDTFRLGTDRLLWHHGARALRLTSDPFIAYELLIPQLQSFKQRHPDLDLRVETSSALSDLYRDGLDAGIRYGRGPWPGLSSSLLTTLIAAPVCAPGLIKGGQLKSPAQLARYPLIRLRDLADPWDRFASVFGVELTQPRLVFDGYFSSMRAAEQGLGIALALFPVTTAAVLEGRLIVPLAVRTRLKSTYQFVCRREDVSRPALVALREWSSELFRQLPGLPEDRRCRVLDEP